MGSFFSQPKEQGEPRDSDAERIMTAKKTEGVDKQTILDILTKHKCKERWVIASKCGCEEVIKGLRMSPAQYDASQIKASIKSPRRDKEFLIEMLCSRSNAEIEEIQKVYCELCKKELETDLARNISGDFAKLLLALVEANREPSSSVTDYQRIDEDAKTLYDAQIKGTDIESCILILTKTNFHHLQKVFIKYKCYSSQKNNSNEVKENLEKTFFTLVQCFENKPLYFATRLQDAMKNKEEKEKKKVLTRIIVSRFGVDLKEIKEEYEKHFERSLCESIKEMEFKEGDYQWALLKICNGDD